MLVLSRKVGQRIYLNNDVVITVVQCNGNRVRIGIEAPGSVQIQREELRQAEPSLKLFEGCSGENTAGMEIAAVPSCSTP